MPGPEQHRGLSGWVTYLTRETYRISLELFKVMVPAILLVKLLESLGMVVYIGYLLEPVMNLVGLPESMGLVWATTLVTNLYAGMMIFFSLPESATLSVAQATVLGGMMLIAHALPVEVSIARRAGVRVLATLLLRFFGALLYGMLLYSLYASLEWLQEPVELVWLPPPQDPSLLAWLKNQLLGLILIVALIFLLLGVLELLKYLHIERLMIWLLKPLLRIIGIGQAATTITIVGMTLGLAYGGGLLIRESRRGDLSSSDIFASMSLLALCHSIIEDTLLILLMGADLSGVLWFRVIFSLLVISLLIRLSRRLGDGFRARYLMYERRA